MIQKAAVLGCTVAVGWLGGITFERIRVKSVQAATGRTVDVSDAVPGLIPFEPPQSAPRSLQVTRFGYPGFDNIRTLDDFVLSYDRRNKTAHWVMEHLSNESLSRHETVTRDKCDFHEDATVHPYFRSNNSDYFNSGFDRGHLAAAGNHRRCHDHCRQTFVLSNISPQVGVGFNRDKWNQLEMYSRHLAKKFYRNLYVCTGPLYLPKREEDGKLYVKFQVIGTNNVSVPTHFFKVMVGETHDGDFELESYVLPNKPIANDTPLSAFQVPLESIERAAGLLMFDRIPKSKFKRINGGMKCAFEYRAFDNVDGGKKKKAIMPN